jgi:oligoendopeptidase F
MAEATTKPVTSAQGVVWDLSDLYKSADDPAIEKDLSNALGRAKAFEKKYRSRVNAAGGIKPVELLEALKEYEAIYELADKALSYAMLLHAGDSVNPKHGALRQKAQTRRSEIRNMLVFFDLEWLQVPDEIASRIINSPDVGRYRHYLESQRRFKPHTLSEPEEKILEDMANTGRRAFSRLFDELVSVMEFEVKLDGEVKKLNQSETLALLYDPDRAVRKAAASGLTGGLKENTRTLTYIFNTLVEDHAIIDRFRSYSGPMASRHLSNEIEAEVVETLMATCERNHDIVERYYILKARLLSLDVLYDYDRYAPVLDQMPSCDFVRCREIVLGSYGVFSPRAREIAELFFEKRWIDAELRLGKRGGAFSASTVPTVHPYILANYTDKLRDVMTIAHELGHGVHQYLSRGVGYLQCDTPLTTAETASVFGEMLVFNRLMEEEHDLKVKLGLLCSKIEDAFATVFRQVVLTRFEEKLHAARRAEGELTSELIGEMWMAANRPMHGKAVQLTDDYGWWWLYIQHFIHVPFYCYAYAFGELLVLALYRKYQKEGRSFVPKYLDLLSAGGSDSPERLLGKMGVDIKAPDFWQGGTDILREMVEEAEKLARKVSA